MSDTAGVIAKPPSILLVALVLGFALEMIWPSGFGAGPAPQLLGIAFLVAGLWLMPTAIGTFRGAGTPIETDRPSERVVTHGVYAWSRNPIYVSMLLLIGGAGLLFDSVWVLAMAFPFALVLRFGVIAREERYLEQKFGEEYLAYKRKVRRWV